jgi:hypothetical protein
MTPIPAMSGLLTLFTPHMLSRQVSTPATESMVLLPRVTFEERQTILPHDSAFSHRAVRHVDKKVVTSFEVEMFVSVTFSSAILLPLGESFSSQKSRVRFGYSAQLHRLT